MCWCLRANPVGTRTNSRAKRPWKDVHLHVELQAQCLHMLSRETRDARQDCVTVIVSQGQKRMARAPTTQINTTNCTNTQIRKQVKEYLDKLDTTLFPISKNLKQLTLEASKRLYEAYRS